MVLAARRGCHRCNLGDGQKDEAEAGDDDEKAPEETGGASSGKRCGDGGQQHLPRGDQTAGCAGESQPGWTMMRGDGARRSVQKPSMLKKWKFRYTVSSAWLCRKARRVRLVYPQLLHFAQLRHLQTIRVGASPLRRDRRLSHFVPIVIVDMCHLGMICRVHGVREKK